MSESTHTKSIQISVQNIEIKQYCIIMPEQHMYLTVIVNSVCTNDKNTTNWRGHCKKLVGIVGEILKMNMTNTKLNLQKEHSEQK